MMGLIVISIKKYRLFDLPFYLNFVHLKNENGRDT